MCCKCLRRCRLPQSVPWRKLSIMVSLVFGISNLCCTRLMLFDIFNFVSCVANNCWCLLWWCIDPASTFWWEIYHMVFLIVFLYHSFKHRLRWRDRSYVEEKRRYMRSHLIQIREKLSLAQVLILLCQQWMNSYALMLYKLSESFLYVLLAWFQRVILSWQERDISL